jgi:hypothetical protein
VLTTLLESEWETYHWDSVMVQMLGHKKVRLKESQWGSELDDELVLQ